MPGSRVETPLEKAMRRALPGLPPRIRDAPADQKPHLAVRELLKYQPYTKTSIPRYAVSVLAEYMQKFTSKTPVVHAEKNLRTFIRQYVLHFFTRGDGPPFMLREMPFFRRIFGIKDHPRRVMELHSALPVEQLLRFVVQPPLIVDESKDKIRALKDKPDGHIIAFLTPNGSPFNPRLNKPGNSRMARAFAVRLVRRLAGETNSHKQTQIMATIARLRKAQTSKDVFNALNDMAKI
tara:strand:+ start:4632 stop:5339 length:708 start_codon:yes stop_codon:yes gene_type:complete